MECSGCGAEDWLRYGSYETRSGERVQRLQCRECERTQSVRAEEPASGLRRGGDRVGEQGDRSRYEFFFSRLASLFGQLGLTRALRVARRSAGVSAATASRWIRRTDADELRAMAQAGAAGPVRQEAFVDGGERLEAPGVARSRFLYRCLRRYVEKGRRLKEAGAWGTEAPGWRLAFWRALVEARTMASVVGGKPFPSWLDRVAPGASELRRFAPHSRWSVRKAAARKPERFLRPLGETTSRWFLEAAGSRYRARELLAAGMLGPDWAHEERFWEEPFELVGEPAEVPSLIRRLGPDEIVTTSGPHGELIRRLGDAPEAVGERLWRAVRRGRSAPTTVSDRELEGSLSYDVRISRQRVEVGVRTRNRWVGFGITTHPGVSSWEQPALSFTYGDLLPPMFPTLEPRLTVRRQRFDEQPQVVVLAGAAWRR